MQEIIAILLYLMTVNPEMQVPTHGPSLSEYPAHTQKLFVERALGEARGDGHQAVSMVIGTMLCREQAGYGTPEQVLLAYYAPDIPATQEQIDSYKDAACQGYKYALSSNDIQYLGIPDSEPRHSVGDTHFFERWVSSK